MKGKQLRNVWTKAEETIFCDIIGYYFIVILVIVLIKQNGMKLRDNYSNFRTKSISDKENTVDNDGRVTSHQNINGITIIIIDTIGDYKWILNYYN